MSTVVFIKKPNICWAFLFFILSFQCRADFYERQVEPVKERAFDSSSQKILLAGLTSTGLATTQDSSFRDQYGQNRTLPKETSRWGDEFGTYLVGPALAIGQIYLDPENGYSHARGLIYTTAVTHLLKETIRRERPHSNNHQSMPSGHTSSAFSTATSLSYAYGWKAAVVAYPVAAFVGYSRIADDAHWFSDTVAGAFIGIWLGRATYYSAENQEKAKSAEKQGSFVFLPVVSYDKAGFSLEMEF